MVVSKFGGTSLAEAAQIKKVATILQSDEQRQIVVVSAPGKRSKSDIKVTDLLYACASSANQGEDISTQFLQIEERFLTIAEELGVENEALKKLLAEIKTDLILGASLDYVASRGEFLNAFIISRYLGWHFIDAAELIVIEDDGSVGPESLQQIAQKLLPGEYYVIPGFYGVDRSGNIKTFTRGGSDITGALIAQALDASLYENWTDVSGILQADPRIVTKPKSIEAITYREVRELAALGFSVLHEEAIAPVHSKGIPIRLKNTNAPSEMGTLIHSSRDSKSTPLVGVTAKSGYSKITVESANLARQVERRHIVEQALVTLGIRAEFCSFALDSGTWFFPSVQLADNKKDQLIPLLKGELNLTEVTCETGFALAAIAGEGLHLVQSELAKAWRALSEAKIEVDYLEMGFTKTSLFFAVAEEQAQPMVRLLYEILFT